ncbi:Phosphomannomutase/phosphoglucomutase [Planctomycetes bacterium Pan216]|uniref:Phosphomannomutase/phosphoglucomutase n=1 Tax=Kolteria novifilia TaxID=2527975 RepID=A0A518B9W9_9BACT|nr:Phosphomannomutase/phosphoglucomutase [Planctomycetes bacterium Pan216]
MGVFKSYDIRGVYPNELDAAMARKIGAALGKYYADLPENAGKDKLHIVVGRDMRTSAPEMSASFIEGLRSRGHDVTDIGMVTTPCTYFAIQRLGADGGIMVTASHNPPQYIGFKVSRELAIPISKDTGLGQVETMLDDTVPETSSGELKSIDLTDAYLDFLVGLAKDLKPLRIAADASNGMAGKYLPALFDRLPCQLEGIFLDPDGTFPNHEADPLKAENLDDVRKLVKASGAAIGFCYDGDADRVAIVDDQGEIVGCDMITALLAQFELAGNPGRAATYDLRSSKVVAEVIEQAGGVPFRARVGHSHMKQLMRRENAICGGELSGHYYFQLHDKETYFADSALVATVKLLNILSATGKPISELLAPMKKYFHTGEVNFKIDDKEGALAAIKETFSDGTQDELDGVSVDYPDWWLNVRPSNTEPLLRLTLEGDTAAKRDEGFERVLGVLNKFGERATGGH